PRRPFRAAFSSRVETVRPLPGYFRIRAARDSAHAQPAPRTSDAHLYGHSSRFGAAARTTSAAFVAPARSSASLSALRGHHRAAQEFADLAPCVSRPG